MAVIAAGGLYAQNIPDSTKTEALEASMVQAVRASKDAPFAVANVDRSSLEDFSKSGKEIPYLLSSTPGVLAWSENGVGTGTSFLRIRGAGDSRINVTIDGVPLNSPEDQSVFWANMNSYSSFVESIQIQRGVGTSTNGDGAFGGSVALRTLALSYDPTATFNVSYGSFNTCNSGLTVSTGLLGNHLVLDGAFHATSTDGYVHGTAGKSGSWYGGATWLGRDFILKYRNIGNYERTGQAWNGVTAGSGDYSLMDGSYDDGSWSYNTKTGIKTYKDMWNAGLGRFNSLYESIMTGDDGLFLKDSDGKYLTSRYTVRDGGFWPKTTDNFWQDHNILSLALNPGSNWIANIAAHYTHGHGYYEEFRYNNKLKKFGLSDPNVKKTDFVRKKGLTQDTYGVVGSVSYEDDDWEVTSGFSVQMFDGNHYGYLTYIKDQALAARILSAGPYKYYDSDALKFDGSGYVKTTYSFADNWKTFVDLQYRHVGYRTDGINDKFYEEGGQWHNQPLNIDEKYNYECGGMQIFNFQHAHYSSPPSQVFSFGSKASRSPSPNRFKDSTISEITIAGITIRYG